MNIIFEKLPSGNTYVYIHCTSAGDQSRISDRTYIHSEYDTTWSKLLAEWHSKGYYEHYLIEKMSSRNTVITLLEFTNSRDDNFIKELLDHLDDDPVAGYYGIEYKLFTNQ